MPEEKAENEDWKQEEGISTEEEIPADWKPEEDISTGEDRQQCLIATAAYGSPLAPQVAFLRHVRDDGLKRSRIGAIILDRYESIYYKFSPYVAEAMNQSPRLKHFMRLLVVAPIVKLLMVIVKPFRCRLAS